MDANQPGLGLSKQTNSKLLWFCVAERLFCPESSVPMMFLWYRLDALKFDGSWADIYREQPHVAVRAFRLGTRDLGLSHSCDTLRVPV